MQYHHKSGFAFQPAVIRDAQNTTLTIEAATIDNDDNGTPTILATYAMGNTANTSIILPLDDNILAIEDCALCVSFTVDAVTHRYVLHKPSSIDGVLYANYNGELIGPSAKIEVWSNPIFDEVSFDDLVFTLTDLTHQTNGAVLTTGQITGEARTLVQTIV